MTYSSSLKIHYIHERVSEEVAAKKKVYPLLLLHGWPGSVREFYEFIPMLRNDQNISDYAFEVIAPSLVGFGWSDVSTHLSERTIYVIDSLKSGLTYFIGCQKAWIRCSRNGHCDAQSNVEAGTQAVPHPGRRLGKHYWQQPGHSISAELVGLSLQYVCLTHTIVHPQEHLHSLLSGEGALLAHVLQSSRADLGEIYETD